MIDHPAAAEQASTRTAHTTTGNVDPEIDTRPAIVQAVERWNRALNSTAAAPHHDAPSAPRSAAPAGADSRPATVLAVERWNRVLHPGATVDQLPAPPASTGDDRGRLEVAARSATEVYPGPVGELIGRELRAAVDFGYRFDRSGRDALLLRLAEQVLCTDSADAAGPAPTAR